MASEACYNPKAAPHVWELFRALEERAGIDGSETSYRSSHPPHAERCAMITSSDIIREEHLRSILEEVEKSSAPQHCGKVGAWLLPAFWGTFWKK